MAGREPPYEYVALEKKPVHYPELGGLNGDDHGADKSDSETKDVVVGLADKETIHFNDGRRRIDYVLAYTHEPGKKRQDELTEQRELFESSLKRHGLELELEDKQYSQDGKTYFLKLHAPFDVLTKWAEILNVRMPTKQNDLIDEDETCLNPNGALRCLLGPLQTKKELTDRGKLYFTAPFRVSHLNQFIITNKDVFFSPSQRSLIVHEILSQAVMYHGKTRLNISHLVAGGAYAAAYPLHEAFFPEEEGLTCVNLSDGDGSGGDVKVNPRHVLYHEWARPKTFYKLQPLEAIRQYFGEKVGIYFAWLGFYTSMLVPAAIVGLIAFIYGIATFMTDLTVTEICRSNTTMCPQCDQRCDCWKLKDSCNYARLSHIFDNTATVIFAIFMSLWATIFIEFWKRKQARLSYDWDVADFEEEEETVRPEYEAAVSSGDTKKNPVTQKNEVALSFQGKAARLLASFISVLFMISLVVVAVFGVIIYRMAIIVKLTSPDTDSIIEKYASIIRSISASLISLICIMLLNKLYERVARFLTNLEMHRTNTQWEDSFTFKVFMFQCVNYYSSIFYIAFFKGRFSHSPQNYNRVLGLYREEECEPAGCLIELSIQLIIIMVGKQALNNAKEILLPFLIVRYRRFRGREKQETEMDKYTRWERDFDLIPMSDNGMLDEYLEMVIQFGFVTLFVVAFPLAPLFALLNNIIEIRLDALKLVTQSRRPLALRAQDIGVWQWILNALAKTAVLSNGFIIAFTSDFVNKVVYQVTKKDSALFDPQGLAGYVNWSLSAFNVSDFSSETLPNPSNLNRTKAFNEKCSSTCWYRDMREGPQSENKYELTMDYWHVLAAKLAFVIAFEHLVLLSTWLIAFIIPDVPDDIKFQVLREKHLIREAAIEAELQKTQAELAAAAASNRRPQSAV